jgi:hypothetical protein
VVQSFVNLYRALCQPSAFSEETRRLGPRQRLGFMFRMTPAILAVQMVLGGVIVLFAQIFHVNQNWWVDGPDLAVRALLMGLGWALVWNVTFGTGWAMVWGLTAWAMKDVVLPLVCGQAGCGAMGESLQKWAPLALASGVGAGLAVRTTTGVVYGMADALAVGDGAALSKACAGVSEEVAHLLA